MASISEGVGRSEVKLLPALDDSFCCFMHLAKPSESILRFFSLAISAVKSNGNPNVSCNLNTTSPGIVSPSSSSID